MSGRRRMLSAKSSLSITVLLVLALSVAQTSSNSFTRYCNATRTVVVNGSLIELGCAVRQNETLCGSLQSALELVALGDQNELDCTVVEIVSGVHNLTTYHNLQFKQANVDFSLCCTFQRLIFSERREIVATDRMTDNTTTVCLVAPPTEA